MCTPHQRWRAARQWAHTRHGAGEAHARPPPAAPRPWRLRTVPSPAGRRGWVRSDLVGEVAYTGRTDEPRLRHSVWRGRRPDEIPSEVTR
ncbi:hypothetical protein ACGF0J_17140 [Nonomuraea sp. NPDC047897]|uniref:ATP dependent DNA ligase n=1 Tax=Nonomuraea sp. NPDC047897 TaxID=3364346 RepID=UPI0037248966